MIFCEHSKCLITVEFTAGARGDKRSDEPPLIRAFVAGRNDRAHQLLHQFHRVFPILQLSALLIVFLPHRFLRPILPS